MLLLSSSCLFKFCENLRKEDNLNNTFSLNMSFQSIKPTEIAAKLAKGFE
ncbi:hypothetical protein BACCELL_03287 [Bacteroides cellulosilyticus DSM 14838]|uniref:Uncharacterized protein n=1 Tax=Bacteroides cellulosilyticus DSM 14838 TaxID=537012 RepID=E2NG65_9BACE|nr:hypothetical protein BACCELL_03287 [Bacteroides cellulosilyticus DSM 14838]